MRPHTRIKTHTRAHERVMPEVASACGHVSACISSVADLAAWGEIGARTPTPKPLAAPLAPGRDHNGAARLQPTRGPARSAPMPGRSLATESVSKPTGYVTGSGHGADANDFAHPRCTTARTVVRHGGDHG